MYLFKAFQDVLFSPKEFFAHKINDNQLAGTFFYGFILTVLSGFIRYGYLIVSHASQQLERNKKVTDLVSIYHIDIPHLITFAVIFYTIAIFLSLLFVPLFIHLGMRIMKGTGSLRKTYQAFIFGSTPFLIFGSFPIIGYAALVYGLYIKIIGLSRFHGIRFDYTVVGYIIGRIIGAIASFIVLFIVFFTIASIVGFYLFGQDLGGFQESFKDLKVYNASSTSSYGTSTNWTADPTTEHF